MSPTNSHTRHTTCCTRSQCEAQDDVMLSARAPPETLQTPSKHPHLVVDLQVGRADQELGVRRRIVLDRGKNVLDGARYDAAARARAVALHRERLACTRLPIRDDCSVVALQGKFEDRCTTIFQSCSAMEYRGMFGALAKETHCSVESRDLQRRCSAVCMPPKGAVHRPAALQL